MTNHMAAKANTSHHTPENKLTAAEQKVLEAVRQPKVRKVMIKIREGKITHIQTEEDIPVRDLDEKTEAALLRNMTDFESIRPTRVAEHENRLEVAPALELDDQQRAELEYKCT
jgi:hypothetical protein